MIFHNYINKIHSISEHAKCENKLKIINPQAFHTFILFNEIYQENCFSIFHSRSLPLITALRLII
jgi:hypothetical protein